VAVSARFAGCFAPAKSRCRSSVVEHSLGKGEVDSSILSGSTSKAKGNQHLADCALPCPDSSDGKIRGLWRNASPELSRLIERQRKERPELDHPPQVFVPHVAQAPGGEPIRCKRRYMEWHGRAYRTAAELCQRFQGPLVTDLAMLKFASSCRCRLR
jgi:hypothetical protein